MRSRALGRKKNNTQEQWIEVVSNIEKHISRDEVDHHVYRALKEIKEITGGKHCAIAWSGGKDSLAVAKLANLVGIEKGIFAHTGVEYPAFMEWVAKNKPGAVEPMYSGHDIEWIAKHPGFLFPKTTALHDRWYQMVQRDTVTRYVRKENIDIMLYGRRVLDGNFIKRLNGRCIYTNKEGVTIYNCIADWTHELLFGFLHYYGVELPPIYGWKNGFREGTHSWTARKSDDGTDQTAWDELYEIDESIVYEAARYFDSAKRYIFMKKRGFIS